jgi:protein TonB
VIIRILASLVAISVSAELIAEPQSSPTPPHMPVEATLKKVKARAIYAPKPEYPFQARKQYWEGVGLYVMNINRETGLVTSVEITQSSGHKILDQAAVDAFRRWRFEPGLIRRAKCPVTWSAPVRPTTFPRR